MSFTAARSRSFVALIALVAIPLGCAAPLDLDHGHDHDAGAVPDAAPDAEDPTPSAPQHRFPHVSPELRYDEGYRPMQLTDVGDNPGMAFDGERYLVAFGDPDREITNRRAIRVARLSPVGELLDPGGIAVSDTLPLVRAAIRVASGAGYFLVAWEESPFADATTVVRYARIRGFDGEVLEYGGVPIADELPFEHRRQKAPEVVFAGGVFVLAYRASGLIRFHAIEPGTGEQTSLAVAPTRADRHRLTLARDGFLLTYGDSAGVHARLVESDDDAPLSSRFDLRPDTLLHTWADRDRESLPALAYDSRRNTYLMGWAARGAEEGSWQTIVQHVRPMRSTEGSFLAVADPTTSATGSGAGRLYSPPGVAIAANDLGYAVVTNLRGHALVVNLVAARGTTALHVGPTQQILATSAESPERPSGVVVVGAGGRFHVAWHDDRGGNASPGGIGRAWVEGSVDAPRVERDVSLWGPAIQSRSAVAHNGDIAVLVWHEWRGRSNPSDVVMATRVRLSTGEALDAEPFELFGAPCTDGCGNVIDLDVASDGAGFLVALEWTTGLIYHSRVVGIHLDQSGELDGSPFSLQREPMGFSPSVTSNGDGFIVTYRSSDPPPGYEIYPVNPAIEAVFVPRGGTPEHRVRLAGGEGHTPVALPDVTTDGESYTAVWQTCEHIRSCRVRARWQADGTPGELHAARFGFEEGELRASGERALVDGSTVGFRPRIAYDDGHYLVVWEDERDSGETQTDIYGALLDEELWPVASHIPLSTTPLDEGRPTVIGDGYGFLLAFRRGDDLRVTRIEPADATSWSEESHRQIDLARGGDEPDLVSYEPGEFLAVYHRADPRRGRTRSRARFVVYDPMTGPF